MIGLSRAQGRHVGHNLLVNSRFAGAVSGTPGSAPSGWAVHQTGGALEVLEEALRVTAQGRQVYAQAVAVQPGPHVWSAFVEGGGLPVQEAINAFVLPAGSTVSWQLDGLPVPGTEMLGEAGGLAAAILDVAAAGTVSLRFGVGLISAQAADLTFRDPMFEAGLSRSGYRAT